MTVPPPPSQSAEAPKPEPWSAPRPLPNNLTTDRLVLRFFEPRDAEPMFHAIEADRPSLLPWLPWARSDNRTLAECIYQVERFRREREKPTANDFLVGIFDRHTGDVIGGTGLHDVLPATHQAEIGYWVRGDRTGAGLCTEAVRHLISWAFTPAHAGGWGLRRLVVFCAQPNAASRRVPEKIGLRREMHLRQSRWIDTIGWCDALGWGVCADEWDTRSHTPLAPAM